MSDDELQAIRDRLSHAVEYVGMTTRDGLQVRIDADTEQARDFAFDWIDHIAALLAEVDRLRVEQRRGWTINSAFLHLALDAVDVAHLIEWEYGDVSVWEHATWEDE